ncbi:MAG TPA: L,D-transpeptidase family protein [Sphingobium sp.]|uniref:L,D-transpeptidase family protein n=1 Tax=Sphingobium sp. TaxID=1912891 RepID=UPI002ED62315
MSKHTLFLTLSSLLTMAPLPAAAAPVSILPTPAPAPKAAPAPAAQPAAPTTTTAPATPALPTLPPQPMPKLSQTQANFLRGWLADGARQGLTTGSTKSYAALSGDQLAHAALDRAIALRRGRVDTADFLNIWAVRPPAYDPQPGFADAVKADRLQQWAGNLTPRYAGYEALRKGLDRYEGILEAGGWKTLTAQSSPAEIRNRLRVEDDAVTDGEPVSAAIQRAQKRYGLEPTGTLGTRTLAALNVPVKERIGAIMANMERWRWLPPTLPENRVQVNIAAAVLTVFEGDNPVSSMRAVTGSPDNQTPMLVSNITSIVVNPPWNVPASIAKRELFPKGKAALARQGYKIISTPDGGERIVQPAGPGSALGRLKFDFNNPFAVYLHDTPSRGKFSSYDRLASHGCVRLEKPLSLAEYMLQGSPDVPTDVQSLIDTGKTQRVSVPKPVAVYLLYWTAFASGNGTMNFREDPYGWDKLLAAKIDASTNRAQANATTIASKE